MLSYPHTLTAEEIRDLVGDAPVMLEIGSHEGTDTVKFLAAMPELVLFSFEPDNRARGRCEALLDTEDIAGMVELSSLAFADIDGEKLFYASTGQVGDRPDWDFSGSLQRPTGHLARSPEIRFKEPVPVKCMRLDTWMWEAEPVFGIDFIWADVQGGQRALIEGGRLALALTRYLYIECHGTPLYEHEPTQNELIALLPGFEPLALYAGENILFRNRHFQ